MVTQPVKPSSTHEPVLLKQYKLLGAVIDAPWATRLDHKIARHVIERYFAKFGNSRASLRYLEQATGAERNKIIPSLRRIIENGVFSIIRQGIGTRPTEYDLNFDFGTKSPSGALEGTSTSGSPQGTSCGAQEGTSRVSSGAREGTQTYLRNMPTGMLTVGMNEDTPAVPTAPPVPAPEGDTAASAVDPKAGSNPFEDLWAVFPRKHHRSKARAAYTALAPDDALHAKLIASAVAWTSHYETNNVDKKWWKHMHTWLIEERYLEDLPEPYENPKEAAIARVKDRGPRTATAKPSKPTGLSMKTPIGRHKVKVVGSEMPDDRGSPEQRLCFSYRIEDGDHEGKQFSHTFKYLSDNEDDQAAGQTTFASLRNAAGRIEINDTSDLHDLPLLAIVTSMGRIEYAAL